MKNRAVTHNRKVHALFVVQNNQVPQDTRVWKEAQTIKEAGYKVSVICPNICEETASYKTIEGIDIYQYRSFLEGTNPFGLLLEYFLASISIIFYSLKIYSKNPFNIIHLANPPDFLLILFLPYKFLRVKIIFDHHDLSPEYFIEKFGKKNLLYRILLFLEKLSYKLSDKIIVTNKSFINLGIKRNTISREKIHIVRNGPDLNYVYEYKNKIDKKRNDEYLIGYVGHIDKQDCLPKLIESIDYIVNDRKFKNLKVLIIGEGTALNDVIKKVKSKNLEKYFIFYGPEYEREKLFRLLSGVDLCVDPQEESTVLSLSTSIKIMEYMAVGKPIVQYDTKEARFTAGKASVYIKNNDEKAFGEEIIRLLCDEEKRREMGEIGFKRVKKYFHWGIQKKKLLKVYSSFQSS